jgi:hypothetical protein
MAKSSVTPAYPPGDGKNDTDITIHTACDPMRAGTLRFWGLCFIGGGTAAVLVDFDHIPRYIFDAYWFSTPFNVFHFGPGRFLHPALFFIGCGVLTCAGGLLLLMVLIDMFRALSVSRTPPARQGVAELSSGRPGLIPSKSNIEVPGVKKKPTKANR